MSTRKYYKTELKKLITDVRYCIKRRATNIREYKGGRFDTAGMTKEKWYGTGKYRLFQRENGEIRETNLFLRREGALENMLSKSVIIGRDTLWDGEWLIRDSKEKIYESNRPYLRAEIPLDFIRWFERIRF